jgi:hypothetical protein
MLQTTASRPYVEPSTVLPNRPQPPSVRTSYCNLWPDGDKWRGCDRLWLGDVALLPLAAVKIDEEVLWAVGQAENRSASPRSCSTG